MTPSALLTNLLAHANVFQQTMENEFLETVLERKNESAYTVLAASTHIHARFHDGAPVTSVASSCSAQTKTPGKYLSAHEVLQDHAHVERINAYAQEQTQGLAALLHDLLIALAPPKGKTNLWPCLTIKQGKGSGDMTLQINLVRDEDDKSAVSACFSMKSEQALLDTVIKAMPNLYAPQTERTWLVQADGYFHIKPVQADTPAQAILLTGLRYTNRILFDPKLDIKISEIHNITVSDALNDLNAMIHAGPS